MKVGRILLDFADILFPNAMRGGGVRTPHDIGAFKRVLQHQIRRLVVSSGGMDESGEVFFYEQYIFIHIVAQKMFLSSYFLVSI